jgi:hypothetical protein
VYRIHGVGSDDDHGLSQAAQEARLKAAMYPDE